MRKDILFYGIASILLVTVLVFFNNAYRTLSDYAELADEHVVSQEIVKIRIWMGAFILLSGALLIYTVRNLFRQKAQTQRKEKELETVFNRISDAVVSVNNEWCYTFLNDAALFSHPQGREATLGKPMWEVHPEVTSTIFWEKYYEAMNTRKVVEVESYYPPMDVWFSVKIYPSADGLTIFYRDVTEARKAEQLLVKSEKIYRTIASSIPDSVICLLDRDYRYLLIEGDMLERLGYSKDKLLGNTASASLSPERFAEIEPDFRRAFAGEMVVREVNRAGYDVYSKFIPLKDENQTVYAVMTVAIDITKLKSAERGIIQLNRDLEKKVQMRTEELRKSNEELEAFSYSVSHDLRAPLRAVIAFVAILQEDYANKLDAEAQRITSIIRNNALRMGHLIDDLLSFFRLGKQEMAKTNIDTHQLVAGIVDELTLQNGNKDSKAIQWDIHELVHAHGDINAIRQVWVNLISNAMKYSSAVTQPRIEIGSYMQDLEAVFYVSDNGVGFDEKYGNKLFKVFQRLHSQEEFEGTGIGLALVDKIVARHSGRVWAEGKTGEGACFYFSLPVLDVAPQ